MRHVLITKHGPPEVLRIADAPDPAPREGEVRIAVRAAGVNFADVMARLGLYPDAPPPPCVVGYEVAGLVDAVGPGPSPFEVGDRVVALTRFGGYATSVVTPATTVFRTPESVSDVEAAALPVNYLTAFVALCQSANVAERETVLVHGAGGGVGIAATQLAKLRGATVIGTASAGKLTALRALGVDHPVDRTGDIAREVRALTGGRGADVVLDPIGGKSFRTSYALLAPLGRLIIYGASSIAAGERRSLWRIVRTMMAMPSFRPLSLMNQNRVVAGVNLGHLWHETDRLRRGMDWLLAELAARRIRPVVAQTFALADAAAAHRYLQSRANLGKVILTP
ncbi:MAG TPA: medium chain dehydrogenase/reductase family protein [Vicinamibacterales bacterium]|nr:medium chain dehydrogenase/reductase family protein [Vicinamibacterales bacterium]